MYHWQSTILFRFISGDCFQPGVSALYTLHYITQSTRNAPLPLRMLCDSVKRVGGGHVLYTLLDNNHWLDTGTVHSRVLMIHGCWHFNDIFFFSPYDQKGCTRKCQLFFFCWHPPRRREFADNKNVNPQQVAGVATFDMSLTLKFQPA